MMTEKYELHYQEIKIDPSDKELHFTSEEVEYRINGRIIQVPEGYRNDTSKIIIDVSFYDNKIILYGKELKFNGSLLETLNELVERLESLGKTTVVVYNQ